MRLDTASETRSVPNGRVYQSEENTHLWNSTFPGRKGPPASSAERAMLDPSEGKMGLSVLFREIVWVMLYCVVFPVAMRKFPPLSRTSLFWNLAFQSMRK